MRFRDITIRVPENLLQEVSNMVVKHGQTVDSFTTMAWMAYLLESTEAQTGKAIPTTSTAAHDISLFEKIRSESIDFGSIQPIATQEFNFEGHLWGQFHRYLPVKFTLRHLALLLQDADSAYVPVSAWYEHVRERANGAWRELRALDKKFMKSRGEQLASGFPNPTKDGKEDKERKEKGLSRFLRHFCVDGTDLANPAGMPAELGFIAVQADERGQPEVGLTQAGLEFVMLENAIFDAEPYGDALSGPEIAFLIAHTTSNLSDDLTLMVDLLTWVDKHGLTSATALDEQMEQCYGESTKWKYNTATCSTYKGGVMGRLSEMKLLSRRWQNRRAIYSVSAAGRAFLEDTEMMK